MTTSLDNLKLTNVPKESYLSYSFEVPYEPLEHIFAKTTELKGQRFFWQTPDRQFGLLGIGQNLIKEKRSWSTTDVIETKKEFLKKLLFVEDKQVSPILFGGLPFDANNRKNEVMWGGLEEGHFILPTILFKQKHQRLEVVLTVKNHFETLKKLEYAFTEKITQVNEILKRSIPTFFKGQIDSECERHVPEFLQAVKETVQCVSDPKEILKKVVLARQLQIKGSSISTERILFHLIQQQPNTYRFVLEKKEKTFIGATPERLIQATNTHFLTASIAGSTTRGSTEKEDQTLGENLLKDFKNLSEHQLVVDRLSKQMTSFIDGNLVISSKSLLKNRDIQHLHLTLKGLRKKEISFLEAVKELHPSPALGGEPKQLAMDWLAEKELSGRGLYGGPIGWCEVVDDIGEFAVGIRSGVVDSSGALLYAGCGIVKDSTPEAEYAETALKFQPMLRGVKE